METEQKNNLKKAKTCPKCRSEVETKCAKCPNCGYEFYVPVVDDQTPTNLLVIEDRTPAFLWGLIGFLCPIAGLVLYILWRKKYESRAITAGKAAFTMAIFIVIFLVLFIVYSIYKANGKVA